MSQIINFHKILLLIGLILTLSTVRAQMSALHELNVPEGHEVKRLLVNKATLASDSELFFLTDNGKQTFLVKEGETNGMALPFMKNEDIVKMIGDQLWLIQNGNLTSKSFNTKKPSQTFKLSIESLTALEIGFGNTPFLVDKEGNLTTWNGNQWKVIVSNDGLASSNDILRIYGALFIGTKEGIQVLNLGSGELSNLVNSLKPVKKLTTDHLGHLLVLTEERLLQISMEGKTNIVLKDAKHIKDVVFLNGTSSMVTLSQSGEIKVWDYLTLTESNRVEWNKGQQQLMKSFVKGQLVLNGSEYLIHQMISSPEKEQKLTVLQGYYPEVGKIYQGYKHEATASPELIECAEESYRSIQAWFDEPSPLIDETVRLGTPPLFWLMVDDYSTIEEPLLKEKRPAQMWYWKRDPAVNGRVPGYWKWEAVLHEDGTCEVPNREQIESYLQKYIEDHQSG